MKKLILLLSLLFILPLVIAQPSFIQQGEFNEGYTVKASAPSHVKVGDNPEIEIHVYNISNGLPIYEGVSCYLHVYKESGQHIAELKDITAGHQFDFGFNLTNNFSEVGDYSFVAQCNNSVRGGFIYETIDVTPDGYGNDREILIVSVNILFIFLLVYGLITLLLLIVRFMSLSVDASETIASISGFFAMLGFYWFVLNYYPADYMIDFIQIFLSVGGFTHVFLPILALAISLTVGRLKNVKV